MAHRSHFRSTPAENLRVVLHSIPWRLFILLLCLIIVAIPAFSYGVEAGIRTVSATTQFFYSLSGAPSVASTAYPQFPKVLIQPGSVPYSVQDGDACISILQHQMRMADAGTIFPDTIPSAAHALNSAVGQDCNTLQPHMSLTLPPQYPLTVFGGIVRKIGGTSSQEAVATPLVNIAQPQQTPTVNCSNTCTFTVQIASHVKVFLNVQSDSKILHIHEGSWIWAQAMVARKGIQGVDNYPYADPMASLNGMSLSACGLEIDDVPDPSVSACDQLQSSTITADGGAWMFAVTGANALGHWPSYQLPRRFSFPDGTRVLLWLSANNNGVLTFRQGRQCLYRYDDGGGKVYKLVE